ncbi:MAG: nucleoside triphosphate pyrophosphohydrolase [Balneolaceae bacterium]
MKPSSKFEDFIQLIEILRRECPWDREQTHQSIRDNLIEEAYEAAEAIDDENDEEMKIELGDLLLQVVFHSRLAEDREAFSINDVLYKISEKLIRRHPHVFGDRSAESGKEVAANWEEIKLGEGRTSILDGLPKHLPSLIRSYRMQQKAGNTGFDWPDSAGAFHKLEEEMEEFREAIGQDNKEQIREEFGDLLFSMINTGRLAGIQPEEALRFTMKKFERRFRYVEEALRASRMSIREATLEQMEELWNEAKHMEKRSD